jgi:hypothetical protein
MNKKQIRLTESDLHNIIKESISTIINEIGDTRRGQYMLGKLWRRKYNNELAAADDKDEERYSKAYNAAKPIQKYAYDNNTKSIDGSSAFDKGSYAEMDEKLRNSELARKGKTKRKSESEIYQSLADKDAKENVMSKDEIYDYALNWLKSHAKIVLRYKGDSYTKERLYKCGCKNLGEYIIYCYDNGKMPGWMFFQIYANKIYKELNLFYDGSTANADEGGFKRAWASFCDYVYDNYKGY